MTVNVTQTECMRLEDYIDHTLLKPTATIAEIKNLCADAIKYELYAVCMHGCHIALAKNELNGSPVKLAAVVGFPLGAMTTEAKVFEAKECISNGADEIDMVINIGYLKSGLGEFVENDIKKVKKAIGNTVLKVIIETCFLTDKEKETACKIVMDSGAEFVKTSTGFGKGGATYEDVMLIKKIIGDKVKIKASGGIKNKESALKYIDLGVSRIGTSSGPSLLL